MSFGESRFTLFQLGFKPYSLLSCSGARINSDNIDETNFIKDPELKYQRKMPDNSISLLSITERIDEIFNYIFQKISSILGEKVYRKFFLRRTLAGCEFGVCFDIHLIVKGERPSFPDSAPSNWRNLIEHCWQKNHDDRPSFTEICDLLESSAFLNSTINMTAFNDYMKIVKPYRPKMTK